MACNQQSVKFQGNQQKTAVGSGLHAVRSAGTVVSRLFESSASIQFAFRVALVVVVGVLIGAAQQQSNPGGAPPSGSGTFEVQGNVRVIDGDTVEAFPGRHRTGIGIIGVRAPMVNTPCGQQSAAFLMGLLRNGTKRFVEDLSFPFDARKRRMYYLSINGRSVAVEMVRNGYARSTGEGKEKQQLGQADDEAHSAGRGCVWNAANPAVVEQSHAFPSVQLAPSAVAAAGTSTVLPASFTEDIVADGFTGPTAFSFLPDGRILVAEHSGVVRVIKNGAVLATPLIDLRDRVNSYWDRGLLGITADPNFSSNGFIYVVYTFENDPTQVSAGKTARLVRYTVTGDLADPASESVLLGRVAGSTCNAFPASADCIASDGPSHTVGNVKFASDGTLFLTTGDGSEFNVVDDNALRSQNVDLLTGKLLHISTSGAGLPSNPFWNGDAAANRSKVWVYGLRNSYRFNLRPNTLVPYAGEVGWNNWEEVNVGAAGGNAGWPCYEGNNPQPGYEPKSVCQALYANGTSAIRFPIVTYDHSSGGSNGSAATGGTFYSGTIYPSEYQGAFFFADYGAQTLRYFRVDANDQLTGPPKAFAFATGGVVNVELGPDQLLYYLVIDAGQLRRIRYLGPDTTAPTVSSVSPPDGSTGTATNIPVLAIVSEMLDNASVTTSTFTLTPKGTSTPLSATVVYDGASKTMRLTPANELSAATTYVATIKGGAAGIRDIAGNTLASDKVWTFTTNNLSPPPQGLTYLSDWSWLSQTNGWGPIEKDHSNGEAAAGDGQTILLNDVSYTKGLGAHAGSDVRYNLGGACTSFTSDVGVDDEVGVNGSVVFQVWADGTKLYDSGVMTGTSATKSLSVPLTGTNELRLVVTDAGDGIAADHGDWANARISCGPDAQAPAVTSITPAAGATGVQVNTAIVATFSEAMALNTINTSTFTLVKQGTALPQTVEIELQDSGRTGLLVSAANLAPGTQYTATVKGGSNGVKDVSGNPLPSDKVWSFTTAAALPPDTQYLSDLSWTSSANGWGPVEKDSSNGESGSGDGRTITLNGVTYAKGLGVHAASDVRYNLGASCRTFVSDVGVDDEVGSNASIVFQVWADGVKLFDSGVMTGSSATQSVSVDITNKNELALIVSDAGDGIVSDHGDWAGARITCGDSANTAPSPVISAPSSSLQYKVGDTVTYAGSATDAEDGTIPPASLAWDIVIHHCPGGVCHTHPFLSGTGSGGSFTVPDHGDDSYFELILSATDTGGMRSTASVSIQPQTAQITISTNPTGLQVVYGGESGTAPMSRTTIMGSTHTIYSPSPQGSLAFNSWSDGGAQQHNVVVDAASVTFSANFSSDSQAPLISAVQATQTGSNGTTIVWSTDEPSDSQVEYGTSTAYGSSTSLNSTTVTSHSETLSGLTANTAYHYRVKSRDASGNLAVSGDFTFTTAAAGDTTPPVISAVQSVNITSSSALINWTTDESSDTQVEYGTSTSYGSSTPLAGSLVTSHSQALSGLTANTIYHYRVKSRDAAGNLAVSGDSTFTTAAAADTTPPVISAVQSVNVTSSSAVINWTTDEASDTQVEYGTSITYGSSTPLAGSLVTSHSQALSGLTANTAYHYRVKSRDAAGNLAVSGDFTFTTAAAADTTPPVISSVQSVNVTSSSAVINWTTDEASDTQVEYGTSISYGSSTPLAGSLVTSHSQALSGLTANTVYHYRVKSRDAAGNLAVSGDFTFTTAAAPDTTPPVISAVQSANITSSSAVINWTTNEASDTQVEYGTSTSYGSSTPLAGSLVTSHSQALSGLTTNTVYHYRVKSRDAAGNLAISGDFTFATPADVSPPVISGITVSGITKNAANINWITNEPADSQVEYGTTTAYGSSSGLIPTQVTSHSLRLTGLLSRTVYHFRVNSRDAAGNLSVSGDFTFTTK